MSKFRTQAPWEFLLSASRTTLQSYKLSRLAHAANLRKELSEILDQYYEECTSAMLARWLIEQRERSVLAAADNLISSPNPGRATGTVRPIMFCPTACRCRVLRATVPEVSIASGTSLSLFGRFFARTLHTASVP